MNKTAKDLWRPKRRIELTYKRAITKAMKKLSDKLKGFKNPNPSDIIKEIRNFSNDPEFDKLAKAAAMKMVTHLFTDAGHTWKEAARENSKGKAIYEALKKELQGKTGVSVYNQIEQNAAIIKTLPLDISKEVTHMVAEESLKGKRDSEISEDIITLFPERTHAKANLIARTEVSKAQTALTRARSEDLGLNWYRWRTSEDQRVRTSHKHMEDVLINWDDPPSPEKLVHEKSYGNYHAGDIFNCRCYPEPLISLNKLTWPHKVYHNNEIQMMSRKQFERIM